MGGVVEDVQPVQIKERLGTAFIGRPGHTRLESRQRVRSHPVSPKYPNTKDM